MEVTVLGFRSATYFLFDPLAPSDVLAMVVISTPCLLIMVTSLHPEAMFTLMF